MKISIEYNMPENDVLEIDFYRGKILLHNVFYDIKGLSDDDLFKLKCEAVAKFGAVFPEVSKKDILKGFSAVDEKMFKLYKETFPAGGARPGAGRPKGTTGSYKSETKKMYSFRLSKAEHNAVRELLDKMRKK